MISSADLIKIVDVLATVMAIRLAYTVTNRLTRQEAWNREVRNRLEALEKERDLRLGQKDQQGK